MSRYRAPQGGATNLSHRPPVDALPDPIAKVLAELGRVKAEHERASNEISSLLASWNEHEHHARAADAAASAEAARSGQDSGATPHLTELLARRSRAEQETGALAGAVDLVTHDLWAAKDDYLATGKPAEDVTKARARLAKCGDDFEAALAEAMQAVATAEWLAGDSFDPRPMLRIDDLVVASRDVIGPRILDFEPVDVRGSIKAISSMVNP